MAGGPGVKRCRPSPPRTARPINGSIDGLLFLWAGLVDAQWKHRGTILRYGRRVRGPSAIMPRSSGAFSRQFVHPAPNSRNGPSDVLHMDGEFAASVQADPAGRCGGAGSGGFIARRLAGIRRKNCPSQWNGQPAGPAPAAGEPGRIRTRSIRGPTRSGR